jgi:hypothetical protein
MPRDDALPLPDYDGMQIGGLLSRIRTLDAAGVQTLLDYERTHAHRLPVLRALGHRLTSLKAAEAASEEPEADTVSG